MSSVTAAPSSSQTTALLPWVSLGHMAELYNHTLFPVCLPVLVPLFFPDDRSTMALLLGMTGFAISFMLALLGAVAWGYYADRYGRIAMLRTTGFSMALATLTIALLPTAASIGMVAGLLLIIARCWQAISASGEVIGANLWALTQSHETHHGRTTAWIVLCGALGVSLAMLAALVVSQSYGSISPPDTTPNHLWRWAFLIGGITLMATRYCIGFILRQNYPGMLQPTCSIENNPTEDALAVNRSRIWQRMWYPLRKIMREEPQAVWRVTGLGAWIGLWSYSLHGFLNGWMIQSNRLDATEAYGFSIGALWGTALAAWLAGQSIDRHRTHHTSPHLEKLWFLWRSIAFVGTFLAWPCLLSLTIPSVPAAFIYAILAILLGASMPFSILLMYHAFTEHSKNRGILLFYAAGCATMGGWTPVAMHSLALVHDSLPGLWLSGWSLWLALRLHGKTRKRGEKQ